MLNYEPEEGNDVVVQMNDNIIYHITNTKNELELLNNKSNIINNISIIDLGDCETKLREHYHININDSLIFIKNEKLSVRASEKNVNFDVYEPYNKTKLNLSICDYISINLYVPVVLSEQTQLIYEKAKDSGYDIFNIKDPFYQDICIPFDSSNGTDIILSDRVDYIYNNDDTQCQSNCEYSFYSTESKYINCSCNFNENSEYTIVNVKKKFNAKKLYESFYDVLKYSNYKIIKCYNTIFSLNTFTINIGSIIVIIYCFGYSLCFFIYLYRGIIPLNIQLRNDIDNNPTKNINNNMNKIKSNINILYPPLKKLFKINFSDNINQETKRKISKNNVIYHFNIGKSNTNSNSRNLVFKIPLQITSTKNIKEDNANIPNGKEIEKNHTQKLDDFELNDLEYNEALNLDKRSLFQIYWATLRREHLIIFTFFNCNDYNLLSIKIARFLFLLCTDMALNVFFF